MIWDLDNTIWEGTLLEDNEVVLKPEINKIIKRFDNLGILQSIASKNIYEHAMKKLKQFELDHYFIYPKIGFINKSDMITQLTEELNISEDTVAFVDDQLYEIEEIGQSHTKILCIPANKIVMWSKQECFIPSVITEDTKMRRMIYQNDIRRNMSEAAFKGPKESFLKTLNMRLIISNAGKNDLDRVLELTERTNQLNTTGFVYSYDELNDLITSKCHVLLIISAEDRFGPSGKVGLVVMSNGEKDLTIDLFIMSCRVISRGIGSMVLNYLLQKVKESSKDLYAKFIPTGRNKLMQLTYAMAGFQFHHEKDGCQYLYNDLSNIQKIPDYVELIDNVCFERN